ncbi:hypothetical protein [Tabrizicola sp.]|uniref:hypothetical protein n=1 Tax=Tabrizicola sp. TaxID=2005166 RepID=UPI0027373D51|nr:hypothetical protein [Tabrizicola sp.]MDP2101139.1 hypothetical protein [Methylotenera sp.]MDP2280923.1 hypothetical protein [Methylotenera sp.]MDP3059247.1 hypothetical protein [Methylotenera sp.]MDP3196591.1 hypothetical protein [Tabrizicola sp.]
MNEAQPKNLKRSLRDKYKRRLKNLAHAVEELQSAADALMSDGGKIRDKDEVLKILQALDSLKNLLPEANLELDEETNKRLCEFFNIEYQPINKNL